MDLADAVAVFAIKSTVVLLVAGVATILCRRLGAAYRHLIWTAGFSAILVLPLLQAVLPAKELPILPAPSTVPAPTLSGEAIKGSITPVDGTVSSDRRRDAYARSAGLASEGVPRTPRVRPHLAPIEVRSDAVSARKTSAAKPAWPRFLPAAWLAGVLVCLAQHLISLSILARAAAKSTRLETETFADLALQAGVRRRWTLFRDGKAGPRTWGTVHPKVALPESSFDWPQEQLEAVILHELAHIRRLDSLSQSVIAIACAANWFNPLAWVCARQARKDAECAADDAVLEAGVKPSVYAEALVQTALHTKFSADRFLSAGVPLMKQSKIEARIKAILSHRRHHPKVSPIGFASTATAALALAVPFAALTAKAAQPQSPVFAAVEVSHLNPSPAQATHKTSSATAPRGKTRAHRTGVTNDAELRAQVQVLRAQLAEEMAQLVQTRRELNAFRLKHEAEVDQRMSDKKIQEMENRAWLQAEKRAVETNLRARQAETIDAETDIQVHEAEMAAKEAQLKASKAEIAEIDRKVAMGLLDHLQQEKAMADLATKQADVLAAQARLLESQAKLKAAQRDATADAKHDKREPSDQAAAERKHIDSLRLQLAAAEEQLQRFRQLQKQGAVSKSQLEKAYADAENLKVELQALKAKIDAKTRHEGRE